MLVNGFLDTLLQKGFLKGVNGCVEHIFAIQQILSNAKENLQPFHLVLLI